MTVTLKCLRCGRECQEQTSSLVIRKIHCPLCRAITNHGVKRDSITLAAMAQAATQSRHTFPHHD